MQLKKENRKNLHYSDYEDKLILLMYNSGKSLNEIVDALGNGRTVGGIQHRINYLLYETRKPSSNISDEEAAKIAKLHIDGKCSSEICKLTGRSDRTVARISRLTDIIIQVISNNNQKKKKKKTH